MKHIDIEKVKEMVKVVYGVDTVLNSQIYSVNNKSVLPIYENLTDLDLTNPQYYIDIIKQNYKKEQVEKDLKENPAWKNIEDYAVAYNFGDNDYFAELDASADKHAGKLFEHEKECNEYVQKNSSPAKKSDEVIILVDLERKNGNIIARILNGFNISENDFNKLHEKTHQIPKDNCINDGYNHIRFKNYSEKFSTFEEFLSTLSVKDYDKVNANNLGHEAKHTFISLQELLKQYEKALTI